MSHRLDFQKYVSYGLRILCIMMLSTLGGMLFGYGQARAETSGPLFLTQYGTILWARTTGGAMSPGVFGRGQTFTSGTPVYYLSAHARVWHLQNTDDESNKHCGYCKSKQTLQIASGTWDAFVATQSHAHAQGSFGDSYYTSVFPDGAQSCYMYWSSGNFC